MDSLERAQLPDRAFAYIDSRGRRRLPIHDEAHVRNALARFDQVAFESDGARSAARGRLLAAAKRFRIVPVGFIANQLTSERALGRKQGSAPLDLPSGFVTMMFSDIEGSTGLVQALGEGYGAVLADVQDLQRRAIVECDGHVVEVRADEAFAVFDCPDQALACAVRVQRELLARRWETTAVRVRVGIHAGYPTRVENNYIGLAVHTAARVCDAAHGGQVLVSGDTRVAAKESKPDGVRFISVGEYRLRGLPAPVSLFQLGARGLPVRFPAPRRVSSA
jgi:class 3 adenylate cyclase